MGTYNVHAGHNPDGRIACGAIGFLKESTEARKVKNNLIPLLRNGGNTVYDCTCDNGASVNDVLRKIVAMCNAHNVDYDVSIHLNAGGGKGVEVLYLTDSVAGIAQRICKEIAELGFVNRGIKRRSNLYVLNNTRAKALLIELCFVDSQVDYKLYNAESMAKACYSGITGKALVHTPIVTDPDGDLRSGGELQPSTVNQQGKVSYSLHVRSIGWLTWVADGGFSGSTGQNRRIEGIKINPVGQMDVTAHMAQIGDKVYKDINPNTIIGTVGVKKRMEAIKIESKDTIYVYRVHQKDIGWSAWVTNGQWAGVRGKGKQIEAVELKVAGIAYKAHIQDDGWGNLVADGATAGTTGQGKRMEALIINPLGLAIEASAHIQGIGWVHYGKITKDTIIGTTGQSRRLECLRLKGNIEYRVHIQGSGWTSWTKADGIATMGTVGQALRIEAIEIRLAA